MGYRIEEAKAFTVDLTRIGGSALAKEIVEEKIVLEESTALIPSVSRNYQLLQKAESFVSRRIVKTRDAFDLRLLLDEGAVLDETLKGHLNDLVMWRELDGSRSASGSSRSLRNSVAPS